MTVFLITTLNLIIERIYWINLLQDAKKINNNQKILLNDIKESTNILCSSILTLKGEISF